MKEQPEPSQARPHTSEEDTNEEERTLHPDWFGASDPPKGWCKFLGSEVCILFLGQDGPSY